MSKTCLMRYSWNLSIAYLWSLYSHVMLHTAQECKYSLWPQAQKYNHSLHFQLQTGEIIAFISPKCNVVIACSWHVQLQLKAFISCNLQLAAHSLQQCIFFAGDVCVLSCWQAPNFGEMLYNPAMLPTCQEIIWWCIVNMTSVYHDSQIMTSISNTLALH